MRVLEKSKHMLEGFQKKIRSHFEHDQSASNFSQYFTDTDGAFSVKPQTAPGQNLFREARSMSDHMRRRLVAKQREEQARPPAPKAEDQIVQRIVESNRASVRQDSNGRQPGFPQARPPLFSVTKQISSEHIAFERRIDEYQELIARQQREIEELRKTLAAAMQESQLASDFALPPTLEAKLQAIRSRGAPAGTAGLSSGRKNQQPKKQAPEREASRESALRKKRPPPPDSIRPGLKRLARAPIARLQPQQREKSKANTSAATQTQKGVFHEQPLSRQASRNRPRTKSKEPRAGSRSTVSKPRQEKPSPGHSRATSKKKPVSKKSSRSHSKTSKTYTQATTTIPKSKADTNPLLNPILNLINSFN